MKGSRRTCLFMSGNRPGYIMTSGLIDVDQIIFDLENAVPFTKKIESRLILREALKRDENGIRNCGINEGVEVSVRVNAADGPFINDDLLEIVPVQPDVIRLPMINNGDEVAQIDEFVTKIEKKNNIPAYSIKFHPMIETPQALLNVNEIITSSKRVDAIAIGGEDYAMNSGINRSISWPEMDYVRWTVVTAAQAYKIDAIDTVYMNFKDHDGFSKDTEHIMRMGFTGRALIHPSQADTVIKIMLSDQNELNQAITKLNQLKYESVKNVKVWVFDNKTITDTSYIYQIYRVLKRFEKISMCFKEFLEKLEKLEKKDLNTNFI